MVFSDILSRLYCILTQYHVCTGNLFQSRFLVLISTLFVPLARNLTMTTVREWLEVPNSRHHCS